MRTALTLRIKLALLSAIPLCCAVALGGFLTLERERELREFSSFQEAMRLANVIAELTEANTLNSATPGAGRRPRWRKTGSRL